MELTPAIAESKPKNRSTTVSICHYCIAAYACFRHLLIPKYRETDGLRSVLLFFSAHIGDVIIFLDVLKEYQTLYSERNGYRLVFACRGEVRSFLRAIGAAGEMEFVEVNRDDILRSYSKFKSAVREVSLKQYALFINPRVVSVIEYVFEYCVCAKERYIVRVDGDESKSSFKERFFRDRIEQKAISVPREMMLLGRFYSLLDMLTGQKHEVRMPRLSVSRSITGLPEHYIVVAPGTSETPSKCWAVENYAKLVNELIDVYGMDICLSGGKNDRFYSGRVLDAVHNTDKVYDYVGTTSFTQWIDLIGNADIVICNDSSPMHIAAAVGVPCVCIGGQWEGSCYYPYVVDALRDDDVLPSVVLGEKLPCYYCTLTVKGRTGNKACKEAMERSAAYPCIRNVKYSDVIMRVFELLAPSNTCEDYCDAHG